MRRLRIPPEVAALIQSLHPVLKRKVRAAIDAVLDDPEAGKALRDELEGLIQQRYGYAKDKVKSEVDAWLSSH